MLELYYLETLKENQAQNILLSKVVQTFIKNNRRFTDAFMLLERTEVVKPVFNPIIYIWQLNMLKLIFKCYKGNNTNRNTNNGVFQQEPVLSLLK
jgi:hypothetical protein